MTRLRLKQLRDDEGSTLLLTIFYGIRRLRLPRSDPDGRFRVALG